METFSPNKETKTTNFLSFSPQNSAKQFFSEKKPTPSPLQVNQISSYSLIEPNIIIMRVTTRTLESEFLF